MRSAVVSALFILAMDDSKGDSGPQSAEPLDISRYEQTFSEEFDSLDVSSRGSDTRWIAHTPWNGDFGDAEFTDPGGPDSPFSIKDGKLLITMKRDAAGKWRSGLLASSDGKGSSFTQAGGGYFEMRAKFPPGPGVWPAFWLGSTELPGKRAPEIDIVEYYGHDSAGYMTTVHIWDDDKDVYNQTRHVKVEKDSLTSGFHLYSAKVDPKWTTVYLDRREVWRTPTQPEFLDPMFILVNLAAGSGWPIKDMPDPSVMEVDYIRAYKLPARER